MPARHTILKFENHYKQLPISFVVYADFECFTKPINTCNPNRNESFTFEYQEHEPSGFCLYLKGLDGINQLFNPIIYTKQTDVEDIAKTFVSKLKGITRKIYNDYYRRPNPLRLSKQEQEEFDEAEICHICNKELCDEDLLGKLIKVRDHYYFPGKYRGAVHNSCNLQSRKLMVLPLIFHNLQGYDANLFVKQFARLKDGLTYIPTTDEKYISFSKKIKFDEYKSRRTGETVSLNFEVLETSLANLVSEFYSKLNDEDISDSDYQHALNVWDAFNCKYIRDFHDPYLMSDVLLLAHVFENFRKICLKHYKLDPAHYYISPGLAWDACLKGTGQELQLLHDYDLYMMFEKGICGGITHISKRYAEANNKYVKDFNLDKPPKFIQYLDANNLYGWATSQKLSTHGFN